MGCGQSRILSYEVQYCNLEPIKSQSNTYKIKLIAEENIEKVEGVKFIEQIGKGKERQITKFLKRADFQKNTIFYYFLGDDPIIKTYDQSLNYLPYNLPLLSKVILLSKDSVSDIPNQIIENETKFLEEKKFVDEVLNFTEIKKILEDARNPNITKDSLTMKEESIDDEDDQAQEKEDEIVICGEQIKKETYNRIRDKFENNDNSKKLNINIHMDTSAGINKDKKNVTKIKSFKICSCKFDNLSIFSNILKFLDDKDIKKFSFYENNINSDFEGWDDICEFLEHNFYLRFIDLHSSNIYDYHLNNIMRAFADKRIRFLNFSENFITIDGVKVISEFLKNNKTLQKLNLSRNAQCQFKAEGVKSITDALKSNPNIEFLDFSYMNLTGCGAAIGNLITTSKSIESIILRNTQLNAVDFKNIFVPLKTCRVLKEIDVSFNDMGGDKSLEYIAECIKINASLNTLKIEQININNDNYQIIFDAIETNKTINRYSVSFNSKLKPKIMLSFFIKQKQVKHLEYEPFDKENPEDKKKELTLEEKKMFEKFKTERPDMEFIYK